MKTFTNIVLSILVFSSVLGQDNDQILDRAYQLRLHGMADSARTILDKYLEEAPESAVCWYELARTHQHMALAKPGKWGEHEKAIELAIDQAVTNDPENPYYLYYKGKLQSLQIFKALNSGDENVGELLNELEKTYQKVVSMDGKYFPVNLTLVEFYYLIPEEMGGSLEKAKEYAKNLKEMDPIYHARAEEILMPEDSDYVAFWKKITSEYPERYEAQEALGRVYLHEDDVQSANICFEKVIGSNPERTDLYLDLARYYLMTAMWGKASLDSIAPLAMTEFDRYLKFTPESPNPINAWILNMKAMIYFRTGKEEEGKRFKTKSTELDPWHSLALGKPDNQLFCPPEDQKAMVGYFFRPF